MTESIEASHKESWKPLIDHDMNRADLRRATDISGFTMAGRLGVAMVKAYWLVGKMIVERQGGEAKAAHGEAVVGSLAAMLTKEFGSGFRRVNLFAMRKFHLAFPKVQTLCEQLSCSRYRLLIMVENLVFESQVNYYASIQASTSKANAWPFIEDGPCRGQDHQPLRRQGDEGVRGVMNP